MGNAKTSISGTSKKSGSHVSFPDALFPDLTSSDTGFIGNIILIIGMRKPAVIIACCLAALFIGLLCAGSCTSKIEVSFDGELQKKAKDNNKDLTPPRLQVFIENSSSMDGYMSPGSQQLTDAVYSYVSELVPYCDKNLCLFYINSKKIPYSKGLDTFIGQLTPASFAAAGGDRRNSDIAAIVDTVLAATGKGSVSMLVSDFILDLPGSDATRYLTRKSIQIRNAIANKRKSEPGLDLAVVVIRMESDFTGWYYYPSRGSKGEKKKYLQNVSRPYYIWIFGDRDYLVYLNGKVPFSRIRHGFTDYTPFCSTAYVPFGGNKPMRSIKPDRRTGVFNFNIPVNMSATLQPDNVVVNSSYWRCDPAIVKIAEITPLRGNDRFTDNIHLSLDANESADAVAIRFIPKLIPDWIGKYNDSSGENIHANMKKTTGISALVQGVADAYSNDSIAAEMKINIKKR